jgi:hypothetical protein
MRLASDDERIPKNQLNPWGQEKARGGKAFFDLFIGGFIGGNDDNGVVFGQ